MCILDLSFFSVVCEDERKDCYRLVDKTGGGAKLKEYCNKWKDDTAVKQCPKTCGVCKCFFVVEIPIFI